MLMGFALSIIHVDVAKWQGHVPLWSLLSSAK